MSRHRKYRPESTPARSRPLTPRSPPDALSTSVIGDPVTKPAADANPRQQIPPGVLGVREVGKSAVWSTRRRLVSSGTFASKHRLPASMW